MVTPRPDDAFVAGLRAGDDVVFARLLNDWSRSMLLLARTFVSTDASAEEVVQDTWLAVIRGIGAFEGRSSLRTWVYAILVNTAKKRGLRESRSLPWSSLDLGGDSDAPSMDGSVFRGDDDPYPGHWKSFPRAWPSSEGALLASEVRSQLRAAFDQLPDRQRAVITLRDVVGHSSEEVCELLQISAGNQRVLLHRARASVRAHVAPYFADGASAGVGGVV